MNRRRLRLQNAAAVPPEVTAWFSGSERVAAVGWLALLPDEEASLVRWWAEWHRRNPTARPPTGAPWITWSL